MIKFDIEGSKVIISPETLTIKAFRDIWDYDKSPFVLPTSISLHLSF